jgi:glycosyltransferase involved in cell wall biosynthesis
MSIKKQPSELIQNPFFSIIIPTRNERKRLDYCLPSILKQSFKNFEIIIVEDPATNDGTKEFIEKLNDSRIKYLIHEQNISVSVKRNLGAKNAKGEYVYFIDADMEMIEEFLMSVHDEIIENEAKIVFVRERVPGENWISRMKNVEKVLCDGSVTLSAARLFAREIFEGQDYYNPELLAAEDGDLTDRAVSKGYKYMFTTKHIIHYETSGADIISHYKKKVKYGASVISYFQAKKNEDSTTSEASGKRATTSRFKYIINEYTFKRPFLLIQFWVFKLGEFACLFLGMIKFIVTRKKTVNW